MATHPGILARKIPYSEESGGLQTMRSQRVGYHWVTEHTNTVYLTKICFAMYIFWSIS